MKWLRTNWKIITGFAAAVAWVTTQVSQDRELQKEIVAARGDIVAVGEKVDQLSADLREEEDARTRVDANVLARQSMTEVEVHGRSLVDDFVW